MQRNAVRALLTVTLLLCALTRADAVPMVRLVTDGVDVTVADGGVGDASSASGVVLFNGSLGDWLINITSGFSKPALGSAATPMLDLNSANLSSSGGGAIDIWLTDTDFAAIPTAANVLAAIGGTTSGTVSYRTFYDASNTPFGTAKAQRA